MAQHWTEIVPGDRYAVAMNGMLHDYDRKILTLLYQPLIGPTCLSLYMTLWAEVEDNRLWSTSSSHHSLMNFMGIRLKDIYEARQKLEGIGLLKAFVKNTEEGRAFIYQLHPPLTPEQFFLDGMLNIYLYKKVGKNQYSRLKRFFSDQSQSAQTGYEEITSSFQDVYSSGHNSPNDYIEDLQTDENEQFIGRGEPQAIQINPAAFNFELLEAGLSESLVPKKALTKKVKEAISNLAFLYDIDAIQMKNIVISAVNEDDEIAIDELRKSARDWYQFQHQDQLPSLLDRKQPLQHLSAKSKPQTQEEQLLYYLDTTSPRQLLKDISGGAEPSSGDLKIIEDVMFQQRLLPGVVNVLIQYVLLRTDMKLTKSYVEKISSHWARKKIQTSVAAMTLAKKEHKQYLEWAEGKKANKKPAAKKKTVRTELLPDWFDESKSETTETVDKSKGNEQELSLKMQEFQEMMKKRNGGGSSE
ncbi:replication initiation and membrane attachment protein [Cytobacillus horneckiae]|uniref:Replication initiation and membrane attachment protein n=1 Tax=Cytobacillus horneckiae TaxID=549687 RepID=A0A2N0ZMH9_9BACI|nr:replication initiation and membrane attachment family protein [Cytobacillus horneckiae]MBN6887955.1 replication initiation and membrane attachment family protein [Cytobacillus horneckiae]MEC1155079.1 replication initiation and membrane attachment family protein [Cytobacillus horneckiae]MED2936015.1 replication initiation and membrane attachment family protein [Cytobacillus horneckiae]PKG30707.1 Replication initiation and membrane attachment protein [Cytobacillus horneckiae]